METDAAAASPERLRAAMVDQLCGWGLVDSGPIEAAMRAVPRHVFVPDAAVERAYSDDAVVTHRDAEGLAVSSASAPGVVAGMLQQLDVRPGHRVLEIGTGTGYNAALLAYLVGSAGRVTTVEYAEEVAMAALQSLAGAGYGDVSVVHADGEFGYADHAPYDRIVVTAGAWDLPPAWSDQLAEGGRIVVPLRMRGLTRTIAFERTWGGMRSRSIEECGFIPMRGAGGVAERNIRVGGDDGFIVRIDDGQPVDADALSRALDHPARVSWTGVNVPLGVFEHLDFWLASMDGFCRVIAMSGAVDRGLVAPAFGWGSMGLFDRGTLAYITVRPNGEAGDTGQPIAELGVCAYGPGREELVDRVNDRIREWDRDRETTTALWVEVHPIDTEAGPSARLVIDKRHTRIVVHTAQAAEAVEAPVCSREQQNAVPAGRDCGSR